MFSVILLLPALFLTIFVSQETGSSANVIFERSTRRSVAIVLSNPGLYRPSLEQSMKTKAMLKSVAEAE
uniref:Uncharacterized protein n=1 Tax=Ditylenchus dipsaci TaxID=166011 RepID=A0A915CY32_9BILA